MKIKIILRALLISITVLILVCILIVNLNYSIILKNEWKRHWTKEDLVSFSEEINSNKFLAENFYRIYDSIYPDLRITTMKDMYLSSIIDFFGSRRYFNSKSGYQSGYYRATYIKNKYTSKNVENLKSVLGRGIEEFTTSEKCFNYFLSYNEFYLKDTCIMGIGNLSIFFF